MQGDHLNNRTNIVGTQVELSARINRYFKMAKSAAHNSIYGKLRHGAVLVRGGSVINIAWNKDEYTSIAQRFRPHDCGPATRHAEAQCVMGLSRSQTSGADIFVCRINRHGEFRMSKPCLMCHTLLKSVGIKRVFYTTNHGGIEMYKL